MSAQTQPGVILSRSCAACGHHDLVLPIVGADGGIYYPSAREFCTKCEAPWGDGVLPSWQPGEPCSMCGRPVISAEGAAAIQDGPVTLVVHRDSSCEARAEAFLMAHGSGPVTWQDAKAAAR
jgi:hypothetical protein